MNGEQNLRLIREIEANREFLLMAYRQNPALLARAEQRIKDLFAPNPAPSAAFEAASDAASPALGADNTAT